MRVCLQTRFARHGLAPLRAPKQCPANGVWRMLWGFVSRYGLLDTVKKHVGHLAFRGITSNFCKDSFRVIFGK